MSKKTAIWKPNMDLIIFKVRMQMRFASMLLASGAMVANPDTLAAELEVSNLINGYTNCTYQDNGNGTSTIGLSINYKSTKGHVGTAKFGFYSRGILIYTYDQNGMLLSSSHFAKSVLMNNAPHGAYYQGKGYVMYYQANRALKTAWQVEEAQTVQVDISFDNKYLSPWPAIGVRAGNFTYGNDVGESTGVAYIGATTLPGMCNVIKDPTKPPQPNPKIVMNAPDWNLGELPPGTATKREFAAAAEQLCFTYDHLKWTGQGYAINATNQNGLSSNGLYQLKHQTSPSDTVPYRVVLRNALSNAQVDLPNNRNVVSTLGNSGRDCFDPTFYAETPTAAKEGDYSDVLTFTIVARP